MQRKLLERWRSSSLFEVEKRETAEWKDTEILRLMGENLRNFMLDGLNLFRKLAHKVSWSSDLKMETVCGGYWKHWDGDPLEGNSKNDEQQVGPRGWELSGGSENQKGQREAQGGEKITGTRHGQVSKPGSASDIACAVSEGRAEISKDQTPRFQIWSRQIWKRLAERGLWIQKKEEPHKYHRRAVLGLGSADQDRAKLCGICMWSERTGKLGIQGRGTEPTETGRPDRKVGAGPGTCHFTYLPGGLNFQLLLKLTQSGAGNSDHCVGFGMTDLS